MGSAATKRYSRRKQSCAAGSAESMLTSDVPALYSLHEAVRVTTEDRDPHTLIENSALV